MNIAISGASGYIGTHLSRHFRDKGHRVISLNRSFFDDTATQGLAEALSDVDVVINLAGATINHRWSDSYKKELHKSRIDTTSRLVKAINSLDTKPQLFISTSAVGYYPSSGGYDEYASVKGGGFLAELCEQWESEAQQISSDIRLVIMRLAVVLSPKGGAFEKMTFPSKFGITAIIGSGKQAFPWIEIGDLTQAIEYIIANRSIDGVVNMVSPNRITNEELMRKVAKHYHSLITLRIPSFVFRTMFGEMSKTILEGQNVSPTKLLKAGFVFQITSINDFLGEIK